MAINYCCYKMVNFLTRKVRLNTLQPMRNCVNKYILPSDLSSYDGPGRTTVKVLNKDSTYGLMVNSYNQIGFYLNIEVFVLGPTILFPKSILSWKVYCLEDINEDSLSLFFALEPRMDILILGFDFKFDQQDAYIINLQRLLRKKNMNFEIHTIDQAIAIFNILNSDGRYAVAGLVPACASSSIPKPEIEEPVIEKVIEDNKPSVT